MSRIILEHVSNAEEGLDIGTSDGRVSMNISQRCNIKFTGLEPFLNAPEEIEKGIKIVRGWAHKIPFENESFDVVTLISVYEHFQPKLRGQSLHEIFRILKPSGALIGQIPNMYFPIELHSWLPFQSFLPRQIGEFYVRHGPRLSGAHGVNWFRVSPKDLIRDANEAGFRDGKIYKWVQPPGVIPRYYKIGLPLLAIFPLGFFFYFRKP
ncbi:MAG: class I SAM-dependent methyltransferase [Nitrososphaerales archaeon]